MPVGGFPPFHDLNARTTTNHIHLRKISASLLLTVHATEMMPSRGDNVYIILIRMRGSGTSSVKARWWESNTFRLSSTQFLLLGFLVKEVKVYWIMFCFFRNMRSNILIVVGNFFW